MKLAKICLILTVSVFLSSGVLAQEKTKIVVIEKVTDENGKIVEKKIIKEGAEAEAYMEAKKKELGIELEKGEKSKTIKKEMKVEMDAKEMAEGKKMKIKIQDEEGEEKVFEWDGEGEMPEEMKKYMKEEELDMNIDVDEIHETIEIMISDMEKDVEEGENVEIRIIKEGESGSEKKIIMKDIEGVFIDKELESKKIGGIEKEIEWVVKQEDLEQTRLGIAPVNHVDGVEISAILDDYPVANSELELGDVIYQINDMMVGSTIQLKDRLKKIPEGETATFHVLRNGEKKMIKVKL